MGLLLNNRGFETPENSNPSFEAKSFITLVFFSLFNIKKIRSPTKVSKEPSYIQSVYKVLFADITLSFDNVIGVVGAAKNNYNLMIFGLFLSVVLVVTLARYFAEQIKNHQWFGYLGLFIILIVALQLIIGGLVDLNILQINEGFKKFF